MVDNCRLGCLIWFLVYAPRDAPHVGVLALQQLSYEEHVFQRLLWLQFLCIADGFYNHNISQDVYIYSSACKSAP